jgi:spermidine synthase
LLLLIGFTATVAQILLMRELLVVFYGNEISLGLLLASWLFWTGVGSGLFGWKAAWFFDPRKAMAGLQTLLALTLPLTIMAVRSSKAVFLSIPGEILGPGPMFLTALVVLCPFCLFSGGLFAAGSHLVLQETGSVAAKATGSVYLLEAVGSGIGGLIASLLLVRHFTSLQIAFCLSLLNLLAAASLLLRAPLRRMVSCAAILAVFVVVLFPFGVPWMEKYSLGRLWHGFDLVASENSAYGNLAVIETEGSRSLLENGLMLFTAPDPEAAEESVHYALLQHRAPRNVLLIGGGLNGSAVEALKHPSVERIDVVELDPMIFEVGRSYFTGELGGLERDSRIQLHSMDGRLFLKSTPETFDVIILNLPEPQTAQLNRFFTAEFFREAATRLNPRGVLSFQLRASENYITPARSSFLRCIHRTLHEVFPEVTTIPGDTVHFFAAMEAGTLTDRADDLLQRLKSRRLETSYVREYYLPFRMAPDRVLDLAEQIRPLPETPVNRDFVPVAYYFDIALWSAQFNRSYREGFSAMARIPFRWIASGLAALLGVGVLVVARLRTKQLRLASVAGCVGAMGFTLMALEILLLLGFQAIYGYVYQQLALLVAAVMIGMALGSWLGLRSTGTLARVDSIRLRDLAYLQMTAALSPVLLYGFFLICARSSSQEGRVLAGQVVFPVVALLCGVLGAYQFPLASELFFTGSNEEQQENTGALYALDLLGACIGAVILSAYLIPVFGFLRAAELILLLNLAMALLAVIAAFTEMALPA